MPSTVIQSAFPYEDIVFAMGGDDRIAKRVEEIIKEIEKTCEPILSK
jgi:hypothetical protein